MKKFKVEVEIYKEGKTGEECMNSFFNRLKSQINDFSGNLSMEYKLGDDHAVVTCFTEKGEGIFEALWKKAEEDRDLDEFVNHYGVFCSELEEIAELAEDPQTLENIDEVSSDLRKAKEPQQLDLNTYKGE